MRGRRSRARKAVSKAPTRRTTPTKRSRTKVRRPSRPVTPRKKAVAPRVETPKPVARRKPTPPKPVARRKPTPVARRKPALPKPVARRKPAPPKPINRKKPVARKKPTRPIAPSLGIATSRPTKRPVTKEIQRLSQIKPITNQRPVKKPRPVSRPRPTPRPVKPKPPTLRKPAVQPIRKKATPKPVARKRPTAPKVPESIQKRIEDIIAARTVGSKPKRIPAQRPKPPAAKKRAAPKKKAAPKKTADSSSFVLKVPKRDYSGFEGTPGSGRVSSGTTVFDRYDPETDTYYGTIGGFAGPIPTSVKGSEVGETFKKNWAAANKGYTPPAQQTLPQRTSSQTPAPQSPTPPVVRPTDGVQSGSFESRYVNWLASKPVEPRRPGGMGAASKKYQARRKKYESDLAKWQASKPVQPQSFGQQQQIPPTTTPTPAPAPPPTRGPILINEPNPDLPPRFKDRFVRPMSPLGTPDMLIASNIVGQSFDPSAAMPPMPPQPPGSVFGGYGQQAPMQATAPFAGMAQANPMPIDFFPGAVPNRPTPRPDAEPVM